MKKTRKIIAAVMAIVMIAAAIPMTAFAADYTIELGETITVTIPAEGYAEFKFTPEEDGKYVVYSDNGGKDDEIDPYVYIYDSSDNFITSDDDNDYTWSYNFYCEFEAEAGEVYYLQFCAHEDDVTYDVTVVNYAEITHQPTADEPYVEVTEGADAEYQWYKIVDSFEVTDENAEAREGDIKGDYATYDSENGWTGVVIDVFGSTKEYNFFKVELEEGQIIEMTADSFSDYFGIWCVCEESDGCWEDVDANETVEFIADHACVYNTWGEYAEIPHLKAEKPEMKKVNTDAELKAEGAGTYVCLVTFDGSRVEVSDKVEITECKHSYTDGNDATCDLCEYNRAENCGCNCHKGGIAGFFFKIVLFFQKLFGQNKVCDCGMNH